MKITRIDSEEIISEMHFFIIQIKKLTIPKKTNFFDFHQIDKIFYP